jgi:transcription initiation factor TFIIB
MEDFEINQLFSKLDFVSEKAPVKCCENENNYSINNRIIICKKCNSIISNISSESECKYYGTEDNKKVDPNRCGMPVNVLLPNSSLGTTISSMRTNNKDIHKVKRFQTWNSMSYKERSRNKVFNEIKSVCDINNIPTIIIKESNSLYTIVSEIKISRGNNRKGLIAACLYFACKNCGVPRSSKEIAKMFDIKSVLVTKGIKILQNSLQTKDNSIRIERSNSINQNDFIERFCYNLQIDPKHVNNILKISNSTVESNMISENTPPSIASGCIYLYCKNNSLNITKKKISEACNISEVTINKCYLKIEESINL